MQSAAIAEQAGACRDTLEIPPRLPKSTGEYYEVAEQAGASDALVTAALLHDVGHLLLGEHMGTEDFLQALLAAKGTLRSLLPPAQPSPRPHYLPTDV